MITTRSTILIDGKNWTMVPKGSVLIIPKTQQARVSATPVGKLLPWTEFYGRNRSCLHPHDVSFLEARGEKFITPQAMKACRDTGRIVVAVCKGGPISIKEQAFVVSHTK